MSTASVAAAMGMLGGALGVDATAALQLMVSEPLVAGTVAGLALGDPGLGLALGAALQLVWCGALPVGAAPFPDSAPATVGGVGGAVLLTRGGVPAATAAAAGLVVALCAGMAGQSLTTWLRKRNDRLAAIAEARAVRGDAHGVNAAVALGLAARFATAGGLALATTVALLALSGPLAAVPARGTFSSMLWVSPLAAAVAVTVARCRLERWLLGAGLAAGFAIAALV